MSLVEEQSASELAMVNEKARTLIIVLVSIVWGVTAVAGIVTNNYTGLGIVTPVMTILGGFLFGFGRRG